MSLTDEDLLKELNKLVEGTYLHFYLEKPGMEYDVGLYKTEGGAWRVSQMQERGNLFVIGTFVKRETAIKEARQYLIELRDIFKK